MINFETIEDPAAEDIAALEQGLFEFMRVARSAGRDRPLAVLAKDQHGMLVAGLSGKTGWEQLFVSVLFVAENERRTGLGTKLLQAAEDEARTRGCHSAWLMTSDPQAKAFYERRGYSAFGQVGRSATSEPRHFLSKTL